MAEQPPTMNFHLSPALSVTGAIDYSTAEGRKYFDRSVEKLSDELFDCEDEDLHLFIDTLKERADEMGWNIRGVGITDILVDPLNAQSEYINILTNHGELTIEQIRDFESTYIKHDTRAAQDTYAMYRCIRNSINKSAIKRISVWKDEYTIDGKVSGNLAFKVLVRESGLDTKTTTTFIRNRLANLGDLMKKMGDDVLRFNTQVKGLIRSLSERGAVSHDIVINLSKGYMACQDKTFKKYVASIIERDEDDPTTVLTPDNLMTRAANKYKTLVQNGTWKAPDEVDKEILALKSELHKTSQQQRSYQRVTFPKNPDQGQGQTRSKNYAISKEKWKTRPKWLRNHSRPHDINAPRTYDGVEFYYCCDENNGHCKGHWVKHKPADCFRRDFVPNQKRKNTSNRRTSQVPDSATSQVSGNEDQGSSRTDSRTKRVRNAVAQCVINAPEENED